MKKKENIHAAANAECCEKMAKKYGWNLLEVRDNGGEVLKKDCVFEGEQTSFESNPGEKDG